MAETAMLIAYHIISGSIPDLPFVISSINATCQTKALPLPAALCHYPHTTPTVVNVTITLMAISTETRGGGRRRVRLLSPRTGPWHSSLFFQQGNVDGQSVCVQPVHSRLNESWRA